MHIDRFDGLILIISAILLLSCKDDKSEVDDDDKNSLRIAFCKYPYDKHAALSITFDDGCSSVFDKIVPMLGAHNLKGTFYIIAGHVEKRNEWEKWKMLASEGHEIGNHSLTHAYYLGPQRDQSLLRMEIDSSFKLITTRLGRAPFSFGHPFHSTSATADQVVFQNHHASKISPQGFCKMISLYDISVCKAEIKTALKKREWIVTTAHGVDDLYCYNSLTSEFMDNFLQYVTSHSDSIFVDTFENLSKYKIEVNNSVIFVEDKNDRYVITIHTYLPEVYDYPLTISIDAVLNAENIKPNGSSQIEVIEKDARIYVTLLPNSSFTIAK